jgi:hypothetical protein
MSNYLNFWNNAYDKRFQRKVYSDLGKYLQKETHPVVLDIGVEPYNVHSQGFIENKNIKYYQMDPDPPNNISCDYLMKCKVSDSRNMYPHIKSFFDVIMDFGVFGWNGVMLDQKEQEVYIENILRMLKPDGIYILHGDRIKVPPYSIDMNSTIFPHFKPIDFLDNLKHVILSSSDTTWDVWFLRKNSAL